MKARAVLLVIALVSTIIAVPFYEYPLVVYGSKVIDAQFIFDYVRAWWQKLVRRLRGEYGPAERAQPSSETAEQYRAPSGVVMEEPTNVYDVIATVKSNTREYGLRLLAYIEANNLPNKSTQVDVYIVPEKIYLTIIWSGNSLAIYDGWIGDQDCKVYAVATITSSLVMDLYENQYDTEAIRSLLLAGEASGELTYSFIRINPEIDPIITMLQGVSSIISIACGLMFLWKRRRSL